MALTYISFLAIVVVLAALCIEHGCAGYCSSTYTCQKNCYKRTCTGWWGRRRCSNVAYKCNKTCYKKVCCSGYTGSKCDQDINECAVGQHNHCKQVCVNTKGSYKCACRPGFILQPDGCTCKGHWCEDTRPCKQTCSKRLSSGGSWWRRTVYSTAYYTCYKSCRHDVCCKGWQGSECSIPTVGK